MITPDYLRVMALHNQWQNETLYGLCDRLDDAELGRNRGMYFGSILDTLNHIYYVDDLLLGFIHSGQLPGFDPSTRPYPDYPSLREARVRFDQGLLDDADGADADWLAASFEFWSERLGRRRAVPRGFYYVQLYNHQTHHRSQVTSELHRLGIDYGSTDLPYNPKLPF